MTTKRQDPVWMAPFIAALSAGHTVRAAAEKAGISASTARWRRNRHSKFAERWREAMRAANPNADCAVGHPRRGNWRTTFIETLAETSNVSASAARAGVPIRTIYKLRREDPAFRALWQAALHEGYDNLEMELLGHLRDPAATARKIDVTAALRLLAAHRETVARERALREDDDEQAVLESIDRFIDDMRQRRAANAAILAEQENGAQESSDGAD